MISPPKPIVQPKMLFLTLVILSVLTALFVCYVKWKQQYWVRRGVPQLEPNLIFGDTKALTTGTETMQSFFEGIYEAGRKKNAPHLGIYNFWQPEYIPLDLTLIKRMLTTDYPYFASHGHYHTKHDEFSENLFTMEGNEWKDRRSKLTPTFTTVKMKMMFETVQEKANELSNAISRVAEANQEIRIKELMAQFTTDVIASIAFGIENNSLKEKNNLFREIGKKSMQPNLIKFFLTLLFPADFIGKLGFRWVPNDCRAYFTKIVNDTIQYRESNNVERKDFMQLLLGMKEDNAKNSNSQSKDAKLSTGEIISEAFMFYLVGFETSSSSMTFALVELAQEPDMQEKLRQEVTANFKKHNGFTYEGIAEMEYLEMIIKETLRKYPVIATYPRECTKNYKVAGTDVIVQKGTKVHIPAIGIHHDPEYYPNPEKFDPERFTPENYAKIPEFAYMPYSEGPKQCLGMRFAQMQVKIAIATAIKDYRFTLNKKTQLPLEFLHASMTYCLKNDVLLQVSKV